MRKIVANAQAMSSRGGTVKNIRALTGIRFFAALWIVVFHFRDEIFRFVPTAKVLNPLIQAGHFAVPLFFILSGFILSHTYFDRYSLKNHGRFIYLRFARLWPVHAAALILLLCYVGALVLARRPIDGDTYSFASLPLELAMVRCWFSSALIWNYPAWSIHSEWFAYLFLFPAAFFLFRKATNRRLLLLTAMGLTLLHTLIPINRIPGRCMEIVLLFLAGSALYRLRALFPNERGGWAAPVSFAFVTVGLIASGSLARVCLYSGFALLIFGLSYPHGLLVRFFSLRPLVYGGTISYSIYMTHALILKGFGIAAGSISESSGIVGIAVIFLLLSVVIGAAMLSFHFIEAPFNRALRDRYRFGSL